MKRKLVDSGVKWLGAVPEGWSLERISSLYDLRNEKCSDKQFKPLSVTMKGIVPQLADVAKTNNGDDRKLVRVGDFVINSRSDRRGSCGISPLDGSVSLINTVLCPRGQMNPKYYNFVFHSTSFSDEFYANGHGIVDDLWTTRWADMKKIVVPSPSLAEQRRIAAFLDRKTAAIDSAIANATRQIELLDEYRKSLITKYVTGKKRVKSFARGKMKPSGVEWIGAVPEEWEIRKLAYTFCKDGSGTTPSSGRAEYYQGNIPWLQSGDLYGRVEIDSTSKMISRKALLNCHMQVYKSPYIAVAMYGASIANTCVVKIDSCTNQACCALSEPRTDYNLRYGLYSIISARGDMLRLASGGSQPNINREIIRRLRLPLPSLEEQRAIAAFLDGKCAAIEERKAKLNEMIAKFKEYRKSLIYQYVTGKKEVA